MRAITKDAYQKLNLITGGMEFASEMIIKALRMKMKILEIPIEYYPRKGESKLVPLQDAWRHIRFMLLYSPTHLFLVPGLFMFIVGIVFLTIMLFKPLVIGRQWGMHFMVVNSLLAILGFQIVNLGIYARTYSLTQGFIQEDKTLAVFWKFFNLEKGLILGAAVFFLGLGFNVFILFKWIFGNFGPLDEMRRALFALTFMAIGAQIVFSSFFLSMLGIEKYAKD